MISIIGAGPSGSYLAYLLAKKGKEVCVFEEHDNIGKPVQCTGLLTSSSKELIELNDEFIVNKISNVKVIAPNGDTVDFNLKEPNYVFDRAKFDQHIAALAMKEGAKFFLNKRFVDFKDGKIIFSDGENFKTDYLVGADGPLSNVSKRFGMFKDRKFMVAMQARVKGRFDKDVFVVYLGQGYFGWSVPENEEYSRVGAIASNDNPKGYFYEILKKEKGEIVEFQSGLIPKYQKGIVCQKDNVFLVGDAATQCKSSTHGGIIQGMIGASALCEALVNGKDYDRLWKKKLGKDLYVHLKIRDRIDKMSDDELNYMIKLVKQEKVKKILEAYDRDYASKIALKLFIKEPRFLRFLL